MKGKPKEQIRASKWTEAFGVWGRLVEKEPCCGNNGEKSGHGSGTGKGDEGMGCWNLILMNSRMGTGVGWVNCVMRQNSGGKQGLEMKLQVWNTTVASDVEWMKDEDWNQVGPYIISVLFFLKWIFVVVRDHVSQKVKCTRRVARVLIQPLFIGCVTLSYGGKILSSPDYSINKMKALSCNSSS